MAGVDCVVPAPDDRVASMALSALVHALGNTGRVAIVRYVKRANSVPTLGVLTPCKSPQLLPSVPSPCAGCVLVDTLPPCLRMEVCPNNDAYPRHYPAVCVWLCVRADNAKAGGAPDMGEGGHPFDCLFLNALPFCEDVRTYEFAPLGLAPHKPSAGECLAVPLYAYALAACVGQSVAASGGWMDGIAV